MKCVHWIIKKKTQFIAKYHKNIFGFLNKNFKIFFVINKYPGQVFDANDQCKMSFGEDSYFCQVFYEFKK